MNTLSARSQANGRDANRNVSTDNTRGGCLISTRSDAGLSGALLALTLLAVTASPSFGQWSDAINLSDTDGRFSTSPHMDFDSNGKAHVVYIDFLSSSNRLYYTTNMSGTWVRSQILSSGSGIKGTDMVITPDNVIHLVYGLNEGLYYRSRAVGGGSWSGAQRLDDSHPGGCPAPDPTHPGTYPLGSWVAGFTEESTGGIYFQWLNLYSDNLNPRNGLWGRYKPAGGNWECIELVAGSNGDSFPGGGWLTANGTTVYCTYSLNDNLYWRSRPYGGSWSGASQLHDSGGSGRFVWAPNGTMAAVWSYPMTGDAGGAYWEVVAKFSTNGGASWSGIENISDRNGLDRGPQAVYSDDGVLHVVWEAFPCDGCKQEVYYRTKTGSTWGSTINLSNAPDERSGPAQIHSLGDRLYLLLTSTIDLYEDVWIRSTSPQLDLSPALVTRTINVGNPAANSSFTIHNSGPGTLSYTISDNASWLSVSPSSGSVTGETDTVTITYTGEENLLAGVYTATITVDSPEAWNAPDSVQVQLIIETIGPDFDGDGDVDQTDFGHLQECLTGAGIEQTDPDCLDARLDWDGSFYGDKDVDAADMQILIDCLSGSNVVVNPACMP